VIKQVYKCEFVGFVAEVSVLKKRLKLILQKLSSHLRVLSHVMQTSHRFPNRRLEHFKTNISRHIFITTDVIAVELRKRNIRKKILRI